jgi:hypothetical protein
VGSYPTVGATCLKRKFYDAMNSFLTMSPCIDELVKVQLIKSFRLLLLVYCFGALELNNVLVSELSVC